MSKEIGNKRKRCKKCGLFLGKNKHKCVYNKNFSGQKGIEARKKGQKTLKERYYDKGVFFGFKANENHLLWKGDNVKYAGIYKWIREHKTKPKLCEECRKVKPFDLANISGKYKRDINDYTYLCRSCHIRKDTLNKVVIKERIKSIKKIKCNEKFYDLETSTSNFIANNIITHNSHPHRKSVVLGTYMPSYVKEKIQVSIGIDTSGSIGQKELDEFLSEVIGMARAYPDKIMMKVYFHDTDVQASYSIDNGSMDKIKSMISKGGGGTSHKDVMQKIQEEKPKTQVAVFLTDGYSDIERLNMNDYKYPKIIVLNKHGVDSLNIPNVKVIKMRE